MFLAASENASLHLGVFINTPFVNYNKSREILEKHAVKEYHSRAVDYHFRMNYANPERRIDSRLTDVIEISNSILKLYLLLLKL